MPSVAFAARVIALGAPIAIACSSFGTAPSVEPATHTADAAADAPGSDASGATDAPPGPIDAGPKCEDPGPTAFDICLQRANATNGRSSCHTFDDLKVGDWAEDTTQPGMIAYAPGGRVNNGFHLTLPPSGDNVVRARLEGTLGSHGSSDTFIADFDVTSLPPVMQTCRIEIARINEDLDGESGAALVWTRRGLEVTTGELDKDEVVGKFAACPWIRVRLSVEFGIGGGVTVLVDGEQKFERRMPVGVGGGVSPTLAIGASSIACPAMSVSYDNVSFFADEK